MRTNLLLCLLFLLISAADPVPAEPKAVSPYAPRQIRGWTVHVHQRLLDDPTLRGAEVLELLDAHLLLITRAVPAEPLAELRKVPIWVSDGSSKLRGAHYHPSAGWLKNNGHDPAKAKAIELPHPGDYLGYAISQPWMILHELAHAYHDRVLGFENAEIAAAYARAKESKSYDAVMRFDGQKARAYAMTDAKEYFAEQSEAYFGMNDFYPFNRAELKLHDPEMHDLLTRVWKAKPAASR